MVVIDFLNTFGARLDLQGEDDALILDERIRRTPNDALIAFRLQGVEYLGYSYAKPTIREALKERNAGTYGERRFFLISEVDESFLEGIHAALREEGLFMYVSPSQEAVGSKGRLIGKATDALSETFEVLLQLGPSTTGEIASAIDTSPQNAKNRIDRLSAMGVVDREKVKSPSGGEEWLNRIV